MNEKLQQKYIQKMDHCVNLWDTEVGYKELVTKYHEVKKWYA